MREDMPDHRATAPAKAAIGQATAAETRPWKIHRNSRGWPRWYQRWLEAWWVVAGKWSLHRAWQAGLDQGHRDEYRRVVVNGGDLIPIMNATIIATRAATRNGSLPSANEMLDIRRKAWERYSERPLFYVEPYKDREIT